MKTQRKLMTALTLVVVLGLTIPTTSCAQGDPYSDAYENPFQRQQIAENQQTLATIDRRIAVAMERLHENEKLMVSLSDKLASMGNRPSVSGIPQSSYEAILSDLQNQRIHLTIDLVGLAARENSLIETSRAQDTNPLQQKIIENLEMQVGLIKKEQERADALYQQGSIPQSELDNLTRMQLTAELKLLEMQMNMAGSAFKSQELQRIVHDRAESKARLAQIESMIPKLVAERDQVKEFAAVENRLKQADDYSAKLRADVKELEQQRQMLELSLQKLQQQADKTNTNDGDQ